ncbi:MAG: hypothetical protein GQ574_08735 [Crocinitomix sp.]|nr:hypothetical protein [Crocinitomix sp.]
MEKLKISKFKNEELELNEQIATRGGLPGGTTHTCGTTHNNVSTWFGWDSEPGEVTHDCKHDETGK